MKRFILSFFVMVFCPMMLFAQRIAVLDFNAGSGVSQADVDGVSAIFNTYFSPKGYTLVERTLIDRVIDEQNFQRGKYTEDQMVKVGAILNVSKIVVGDVNVVMNQYNVDVRVINVQSGTIAAKDGVTWSQNSSCRDMMKVLATRLAAKIAIKNQDCDYVEKKLGLNMKMVFVEGGTFQMGATSEQDDAYDNEKPVRNVSLDSYYIGACEVTQAQWEKVMGTSIHQQAGKIDNTVGYCVGPDYPMCYVSWEEAQIFCRELSRLTGKTYMLPTEAQWEYAARGGNKKERTMYSGSCTIDKVAWYHGNSEGRAHMVGKKMANALGIYDMTGNVLEWCSDWYGPYQGSDTEDPKGASSGDSRVNRGGSWGCGAEYCRVSFRFDVVPWFRDASLGFRVVCLP